MRIAIVTQALYPDIVGGAPIGAHELATALTQLGHDVVVHTVAYARPPEGPAVDATYGIVRHKARWTPWDRIGTAGNPWTPTLLEAVRSASAGVVHLRSHLFFTSLLGYLGARKSGKAVVLSVHGVRAVRGPAINALQEAWLRSVGRFLLRRADRVVCLTDRDRDEVVRYGAPPERTVVLFNAYNDRLFHPSTNREPVVAWAGRHVPEKGLEHLVKAWATVSAKHPEWRLVLIGEGPLLEERRGQAEGLGLQGRVEFRPFQPQDAVAQTLATAAVFALPSIREGFPISLAEAMASGCAIVTTQGLEDVVGDAGITVPPGDPVALSKALERVLQEAAVRQRMGAAGVLRAQGYSPSALAKAYVGVYEDAVREAQKAGRSSEP